MYFTDLFFTCKISYNPFISILRHILKCNELENLHLTLSELPDYQQRYFDQLALLGVNDRSSVYIKTFHDHIDKSYVFLREYLNYMSTHIKPLYKNKPILIQKTPNLRISFPNLTAIGKSQIDNDETVGLHNDANFGHSEHETNVIIPLTKMYDSNSIFFEPAINSNIDVTEYNNLKLDEDQIFIGYFNKLNHYNKVNLTGSTRVSFDIRVILYDDYLQNESKFIGTKFEIGNYFVLI
jgi:hypothetical protein